MTGRHAVLALLPWISACKLLFPAPNPMASLPYPVSQDAKAPAALVLLPGRGDTAEAYAEHGFIDDVRARQLPVDVVAANATYGYYLQESLHERLNQDVLAPLLSRGYARVWLGGISMGGLGALLAAQDHPGRIDGVVLLAPYLGEDAVLEEIERAGGLRAWQPPVGQTDYQRDLWRYLKSLTDGTRTRPVVYLGFGETDRLVRGHRLLAAALPKERVFRTEGGHEWAPWKRLWAAFLAQWQP